MKKYLSPLLALSCLLQISPVVHAEIDLWDWGINIDGTSYCLEGPCDFDIFSTSSLASLADLPSSIDYSSFNLTDDEFVLDGMGTLNITIDEQKYGVGPHSVTVYLNYDIDYDLNGELNETGTKSGTPGKGISWEIDEIGFGVLGSLGTGGNPYVGDIFENFVESGLNPSQTSALDNQIFFYKAFLNNEVDQSLIPPIEDAALAQSFDFELCSPADSAVISFKTMTTKPTSGFYLVQQDTDSGSKVYLAGSIEFVPGPGSNMDTCGTCDNDPTNDCVAKPFPWLIFLNIIINAGK